MTRESVDPHLIAFSLILRHWRGLFSLKLSFFLFLLIPSAFVLLCYTAYESFVSRRFLSPDIDAAIVYGGGLLTASLLIWQIVGTLRSADRFMVEGGDRSLAFGVQGISLIAVITMTILAVDSYQALQQRIQAYERFLSRNQVSDYSFEVDERAQSVRVAGSLEVGITRSLSKLLNTYPALTRVEFDSLGGRVYEGRALMKLIRDRGLDTYLAGECYSACAMAFMGGNARIMHRTALLGFHQYKSYTVQPNVNVDIEQGKDIALMIEQGVNPDFANAIFEVSSEEIWIPPLAELKENFVITQVVDMDKD